MSEVTSRRPALRLEGPRRARPGDVHAHQPAASWPPVEPGSTVSLYVGFGLSVEPLEVVGLARHLAPAAAVRIAARTPAAARNARSTLSALFRGGLAEADS